MPSSICAAFLVCAVFLFSELGFWFFTLKESSTFNVSEAKELLQDAQKRQDKARVLKNHTDLKLSDALKASVAAQREVDEADVHAGRILFFLHERGYPLVLCSGEHHIEIDHGSLLILSFALTYALSSETNTVYLPGEGTFSVVLD